jgi:dihydropteroate synthase
MGILNVTPDSFSDGGHFFSVDAALTHAQCMVTEGANIIDIGGESTRPNAQSISIQEELDRVMPVIEKIRATLPVRISIDTSKAQVMHEAIAAGVDFVNDVYALRRAGCLAAVAAAEQVQVCLMHMQGEPQTMQQNPYYNNVVEAVKTFLQTRIQACLTAGIAASRIIIDPGIGFGKSLTHNLQLLQKLSVFTELDYPVLVGVSRKSLIGHILNKPVSQRLYGGLALAVLAVNQGARIVRTHDVGATVEALKVTQAILDVADS